MRQGLTTSEAGKLGGIAASKTAAIRKQKRIDDWNDNPKLCLQCYLPLSYDKRRNDFCSQSCAASNNNIGVRKHISSHIFSTCLNCKKVTSAEKYCSKQCQQDYQWNLRKTQMIADGVDNSAENNQGKRYLIELHKGKCQDCGLDNWNGQKMPLVLDHIDGDPYNNLISNLRVICNNCDAISPTYKGRNKGNGRFKRAERYKLEKELFGNVDGLKFKH